MHKIFLITFFFQIINAHIPLYIIYSHSHKTLYHSYFLPSLKDNFELHVHTTEQSCASAEFKADGWKETMEQKVTMIINGIQEQWGTYMIYSDVDIQFFDSIEDEIKSLLEQYDLVIQKDNPKGSVCAGFFACRCNEKTLQLWQDVLTTMQNNKKYKGDQAALNYCLRTCNNPYNLAWTHLPATYFGAGTFSGTQWKEGQPLHVPENPKMHHANWTIGIKNKIAQLNLVKYTVLKRKMKTKNQATSSFSRGKYAAIKKSTIITTANP